MGLAPEYFQVSLVLLPPAYASNFRDLCTRNPVPDPLVGLTPLSRTLSNQAGELSELPTAKLPNNIQNNMRSNPQKGVCRLGPVLELQISITRCQLAGVNLGPGQDQFFLLILSLQIEKVRRHEAL